MQLAKGEVELIITGDAYVSSEEQAVPRQMDVYREELLPGLQKMIRPVHDKVWMIEIQI